MPRRKPLYSLKTPKYRPSWNKYNLFNMSRVKSPLKPTMTFFQQKWYSKSMTRTYHGNTIREKQWRRIFRPDMRSVVSMDVQYLGTNDGSDYSAGRGAGRLRPPKIGSLATQTGRAMTREPVPYMNMIYHQLERRLDVAIWRALFASSTRQARQFCTHGGVKVNGKKMVHPGYLLNPGDMFQVDVERVLFATGARKSYWERRFGRQDRKRGYGVVRTKRDVAEEAENEEEVVESESTEGTTTDAATDAQAQETPKVNKSKDKLQEFLMAAKATLDHPRIKDESASHKRALREFARTVRKELSSKASWNTPIDEQITELASKLSLYDSSISEPVTAQSDADGATPPTDAPKQPGILTKTLQADQERLLKAALKEFKDNPVDYTKGYKTPWEPKPFMSPFAFIPRYLEVHAPICAAVYLRHPVARAGLGEVPTPYDELTNGLAFNWYLRRR